MPQPSRLPTAGSGSRCPAVAVVSPSTKATAALLDALASVGGIALSNADLYAEVERQKDNLSVITRSLGEGVCAISRSGDLTFMNPAGAAMLGWEELGPDGRPRPGTSTPRFLLDPALARCPWRRTSAATTPASSGPTAPISR